jgi:large subunit ribosomal protein L3
MVSGLIGKKVGMTQIFREDGVMVPCTVIQAGPCVVVQKKTAAKEGYDAVQLGMVEFVKPKRVNQPMAGHYRKAGVEPGRKLREFKLVAGTDVAVGQRFTVEDVFKPNDKVDVIATSIGRGWQGFVKRHHFRGGEGSHGSMFHRAPGSIGASSFPSRVFKGQRMAGQMGNAQITVRNLEVLEIDGEDQLLVLKGSIPGPENGYVEVRRAKKVAKK